MNNALRLMIEFRSLFNSSGVTRPGHSDRALYLLMFKEWDEIQHTLENCLAFHEAEGNLQDPKFPTLYMASVARSLRNSGGNLDIIWNLLNEPACRGWQSSVHNMCRWWAAVDRGTDEETAWEHECFDDFIQDEQLEFTFNAGRNLP